MFTPKNINSITIIIISEGIWKSNQNSKRYLEHCRRRVGVYFLIENQTYSLQNSEENRKITQKKSLF